MPTPVLTFTSLEQMLLTSTVRVGPDGLQSSLPDGVSWCPHTREVRLITSLPGHLHVVGEGYAHAFRYGPGEGDAVRGGAGNGNAIRVGPQYGHAVRYGPGIGGAYTPCRDCGGDLASAVEDGTCADAERCSTLRQNQEARRARRAAWQEAGDIVRPGR